MLVLDNPAARLYAILRQIREKPNNTPAIEAWAHVLRVSEPPTLMVRYAAVVNLPVLASARVEALGESVNRELQLRWVARVREAVRAQGLGQPIEWMKGQLDDATMVNLEHCADLLSRNSAERVLTEAEAASIDGLLRELLELLREAPADVAAVLKPYVEAMQDALHTQFIVGIAPLERAVEQVVGAIVSRPEVRRSAETPVGKQFWSKVGKVMMIVQLISYVTKLPGEVHDVMKLLKPGSSTEHVIDADPIERGSGTLAV